MSMIEVVETKGPVLLLRACGRLNRLNVDEFEADVKKAMARRTTDVVIEASNLTYVSSAGLRALFMLSRTLGKFDRHLRLCGLQPYIREVFEVIGFDRVIQIYPDVPSALSASGSQPQN